MSKEDLNGALYKYDEEIHRIMAITDIMWVFSRAAEDTGNKDMELCGIKDALRYMYDTLWDSSNAIKEICDELREISSES